MITGLSHICFVSRDLDAAVAFYVSIGGRHAFDFTRDGGDRYGAYLHLGGRTFVEIFAAGDDAGEPGDEKRYRHLCLEVDGMEATVDELRSRGLEVGEVKRGSDGNLQAWLADPDGNRIELMELAPDGLQMKALKGGA